MRPYTILNAVELRNATAVNNRLKAGESPDSCDRIGYPVLMTAIGNSDYEICRALIDAGANPNLGFKDNTPLMMAILCDDIDVAELLLGAGADIEATDKHGRKAADYVRKHSRCFPIRARLLS